MQNTKYNKITNKLQTWFFGFWIKNRRVSFLVMWIIAAMWMIALITIPKESSPEINLWIISITTVYQWATPQDIDNLITDKIEKEIKDIEWIKKINSTSSNWFASTVIEFKNNTDMMQAMVDVNDAIDDANLPSDVEDPSIQDISTNNEMMFSVLIYGDKNKFSEFYIKEKWRILKENIEWKWWINKIDFDISADNAKWMWWTSNNWDDFYNIDVLLDKQKVQELWLSILQVSQTIKNRNSNQPLGNNTIGELWYSFRIQWEIKDIQELRNIPIQTNKWYVTLKNISTIQKTLKTDKIQNVWLPWLSGQNYVSLIFNKENWKSIFSTSVSAKELLKKEFQKTQYKWLSYIITLDLSEVIIQDYSDLAKNAAQTLLLVFMALLIFVWFKESLIATITLPLAFFITFIVLQNMWLSLNFLTNFSLIVTFWIAIDTTIVIVEWAHEKLRQWFNPKNAVLLAVKEYKNVLIAWTSTTLVVFLPLLTLPWVMGKFLSYIPITIFITLAAALFISLTLNSALYYKLSKKWKYFNSDVWNTDHMSEEHKILLTEDRKWKTEKPEHKKNKRDIMSDKLAMRYFHKLWNSLRDPKKRLLSILIPIAALILSFIIISPNLWFKLIPSKDNWYLAISIAWPNSSTKEYMQQYNDDIEKILSNQQEVKVYYSTIAWDTINTSIELLSEQIRKDKNLRTTSEFETDLDDMFSYLLSQWLDVTIKASEEWPWSAQPIGIKLTADDSNKLDILKNVSSDFESFLATKNGIKNIKISSKESPWQFVYTFDKIKMTLLWLTPNNFKYEAFAVSNGLKAWTIKWNYDDNDIEVFFAENTDNNTPQSLDETNINTPSWKINFGNITNYNFTKSVNSISRENNKIIISIWADTENKIKPDQIQTDLKQFAETYQYPVGINYYMWWENEENVELIQTILISFIIAILFIFLILVLQFNSYTQPIIILYSVLVWLLWGNIWLWIMWEPYSMMFWIWFIALTGIIVNDSIVLLDRTNRNIARWMTKENAITEAGKSRLQPIILTTITTFFGLMSIIWDAMWKSLAITIMVWIIFGSAATLFVIPSLHYDKDKLKHIFKRTLLKYILYLLIPLIISVSIIFILMMLNIATTWVFKTLLLAIFVWFNIRYSFYTIYAWSNTGQTMIQKLLWIKILNSDNTIMTEKQATKRFFITTFTMFGPAIIWIILSILIWFISSKIWNMVWVWIALIWYLTLAYKSLLLIWTKNNLSLNDKLSNTITVDQDLK